MTPLLLALWGCAAEPDAQLEAQWQLMLGSTREQWCVVGDDGRSLCSSVQGPPEGASDYQLRWHGECAVVDGALKLQPEMWVLDEAIRRCAPGIDKTCVVTEAGTLRCVDRGTTWEWVAPAGTVQHLVMNLNSVCAQLDDESLWCTPYADSDRHGAFEYAPTQVASQVTVTDGTCWNGPSSGCLEHPAPVDLSRMTGLASGLSGQHCALDPSGSLSCWFEGHRPDPIVLPEQALGVAIAGDFTACALLESSELWCWPGDPVGLRHGKASHFLTLDLAD